MKMTFRAGELQPHLLLVKTAINTHGHRQELASFHIALLGDELVLTGTNEEVMARARLRVEGGEDGTVIVPADMFTKFISTLNKEDEVKISTKENTLFCKTKVANVKIMTYDPKDYPILLPSIGSQKSLSFSQEDFLFMFTHTVPMQSTNVSRMTLCGTFVRIMNNHIVAVAADGMRLSRVRFPIIAEDTTIGIIPKSVLGFVQQACKLAPEDEPVQVQFNEKSLSVQIADSKFYFRFISGPYPPVDQTLSFEPEWIVGVNTTELRQIIKQVLLFSKENDNKIHFTVDSAHGKLCMNSVESALGHGVFEMDVEIQRKPDEGGVTPVIVNGAHVLKALELCTVESVLLELCAIGKPFYIREPQSDRYMSFVMPMRF